MVNATVVELSRIQFAATALYHYLFIPVTLGMTFFLAAIETVYVVTGKPIYKQMAQFWAKLFLINFALGVATGLTMEFEFGTNWSFYSSFVGDVFGAPLAIEGLMAFFLESTFIGMMVFGWERLGRGKHLAVTYLVALGSNLSALWILVANSFMQSPHGLAFDYHTLRLQLTNFSDLIFSNEAQAKFVHTSVAGYVTAAIAVCGISAFYMARGRHLELARRSFRMAAVFGVLATAGVITLGDALGFIGGNAQPAKLAAMEGIWQPEAAPMSFNAIAFPSQKDQKNYGAVQVPYVLSLLETHSLTGTVPAISELEKEAEARVRSGIPAVQALQVLATHPEDSAALALFNEHKNDLGYGFLAQRYTDDLSTLTPAQVTQTAKDSIPPVAPVFWAFRLMVGLGLVMFAFFVLAMIFSVRNDVHKRGWFLKIVPWLIPVPFLANECGWVVAEVGRQPWTVYGVLPTWMSASTHSVGYMVFSLIGFVSIYTIFIIIEMTLMVKAIKQGPDEVHVHDVPVADLLPGFAGMSAAARRTEI
ncbi:cytochrome ubiquinol oxidase subunit I [Robbsia sp. KACC 23696]|uniref:cytochrome ubiquinol oxidase subunit I n=1 Tax=Robbsia sp. KACC 23696 TaxID=3149231 RepID=UPI00325B513C